MSKTKKYAGTWRLYEKESLFDGVLFINEDERDVALVIDLPASREDPWPRLPYLGTLPYISGTLFSGAQVLLYNCLINHPFTHVASYSRQIIHADYAFWHLQVESQREMEFTGALFDFGEIVEWSGLCSYEWKLQEDLGFNILWNKKEPITINYDENTKLTFHPSQGRTGNAYSKENRIIQRVLVELSYRDPTPWDSIMDDALSIQYLIGLGVNQRITPHQIRYYYPHISGDSSTCGDPKNRQIPVDVSIGTGGKPSVRSTNSWDYLYTLDSLMKNGGFGKWKENYIMLKPVLDLYFSTFSKAYEPEITFLNLMQALETYHARFFANDLDEYRARVEELVNSFSQESDNRKRWSLFLFSENQEKSRYIHLRSRLADLIFGEGRLLLFPRVPPTSDPISKLVHTRNYYTHYKPELLEKAYSPEELPWVAGYLEALLQYHLLVLLGFEPDEVRMKMVEKVNLIVGNYNIFTKTIDVEKGWT